MLGLCGFMAVTGAYVGLSAAELSTLRAETLAAISGVLKTGVSYSVGGRSFTKADLPELRENLAELNYALGQINGTVITSTVPRFRFP